MFVFSDRKPLQPKGLERSVIEIEGITLSSRVYIGGMSYPGISFDFFNRRKTENLEPKVKFLWFYAINLWFSPKNKTLLSRISNH